MKSGGVGGVGGVRTVELGRDLPTYKFGVSSRLSGVTFKNSAFLPVFTENRSLFGLIAIKSGLLTSGGGRIYLDCHSFGPNA